MNKKFLALVAATSIANLLAVVAVVEFSVSVEAAFLGAVAIFAVAAGLLLWRNGRRDVAARVEKSYKTSGALIWLLVPFTVTALVAVIQALHERWGVGDTIGASFFGIFAALS